MSGDSDRPPPPPKKSDKPESGLDSSKDVEALNGHSPNAGARANGASSYDAVDAAEAEAAAEPLPPLPPPPDRVAELTAACMRFVASKYKVPLDGGADTLSLVDQYIRDAREAVRERPETIGLVAPAVGAYLGEVMRQTFRGEWWAEGDYDAWRLYFSHVYLAFNPIGMGREAITMSEEPGWGAHLVLDPGEREMIEERLAAMPEVDEEEYFLPTTRFDVVTVVVETLRATAEAAGTGDVTFTKDDYDTTPRLS